MGVGVTVGAFVVVSSATEANGGLFGYRDEAVDDRLPNLSSRENERVCLAVYGAKEDTMEVRSSIGGASFIVTRRGARPYDLVDGFLLDDMGFLVGDSSKNLARLFARRRASSSILFDWTSALILLFPPNLDNDTICSLTAFSSLSTALLLFSSLHLSLCIAA